MYTYMYTYVYIYVYICTYIYIYEYILKSKGLQKRSGGMADVPPKVRTETDLNMPTSTDECS